MADMIRISSNSAEIQGNLQSIRNQVSDLSPVMKGISLILLDATEQAFASEGPGWRPLSERTKRERAKKGKWPGKILQVTGQLAASVSTGTGHDELSAWVGTNKDYAYDNQFGAPARKGHGIIPARPFLPMDEHGNLRTDTEEEIMDFLSRQLSKIIG